MRVLARGFCLVEIMVADVRSLFHHSPFTGANDEKVGLSGWFTRGVARRLALPRAIIFCPFRASGISLNGFDRAWENYIFDLCAKCLRAAPFWPGCLIKSAKCELEMAGRILHCPQNLTAFGAPDYDLARFLKALVLSRLQTGAPGAVSGCAQMASP